MRHLVVGTAGHIDHGKSALVEALTGVNPDRLAEEKRRGITIDLGFADLDLTPDGVVGFIDVPGHERFVRHMVAGSTGIDAAILVVAADEGVMPQTREHVAILSLLGVAHGFTVLAKIDLLEPELHAARSEEVRGFLRGSPLAAAPIVAASARTGIGLDAIREALRGLLAAVPRRAASGAPRLAIDRSFVMKGFGTVVTGTLTAGRLSEGDDVEILPSGKRGRIRGLQVHNARVAEAQAGGRLAINLQGLTVEEAARGATLTLPGALLPTRRARVTLRWLGGGSPPPRTAGMRIHHGTWEGSARLRKAAAPAAGDEAELEFSEPVVLVPGDRFVLRLPAPRDTVGGGVVLDAHPPRGRVAARRTAGAASRDPVRERIARAGLAGRAAAAIAAELGWSRDAVDREIDRLEAAKVVVRAAGLVVDGAAWAAAETAVRDEVDRFHRAEPLAAGVRRDALRKKAAAGTTTELFRELIDRLVAGDSLRAIGDRIAAKGFRVLLPPEDAARSAAIEAAFRRAGLDPPDPDEAKRSLGGPHGARLLELLVEDGRLVRLPDGLVFHAEALGELRRRVRDFGRTSGTMDVAAFKKLAGVTRKNAIPLLEQLDAERVTRRVGNVREILSRDAAS